jgi:hypothetical protein
MDVINLGAAEGLPPVDWESVAERLQAGSNPHPDAHNAWTTSSGCPSGDPRRRTRSGWVRNHGSSGVSERERPIR